MNTVQFNHDMENGVTYALDVNFNAEDLLEQVHADQTEFMVGESYLNPKDKHYSKKIGREVASKRLKPVKFLLCEMVRLFDDKWHLTFTNDTHTIEFRVSKNSEKPHFLVMRNHTDLVKKSCCKNRCC